jgi:hypothetical protein
MADYELRVKSLNEGECKTVKMGHQKFVMAKSGSKYHIDICNKSKYACDAALVIAGVWVGTYRVDAGSICHLEKCRMTKKEFCFDNGFHHIKNNMPNEETCGRSSVSVTFMPANKHVSPCYGKHGGFTDGLCHEHIDWHKMATITLPILICDHHT